jgi:hypothetical protein
MVKKLLTVRPALQGPAHVAQGKWRVRASRCPAGLRRLTDS